MTKLYTFSPERFPELAQSRVGEVYASKLYFLYNGRNAWHSTWTQQYTDGCMHLSIETAEYSAERQRVQGSVFYIEEWPALVLSSSNGILAITEIHAIAPLSHHASKILEGRSKQITRALENLSEPTPVNGGKVVDVVKYFYSIGSYQNQVMAVCTEDTSTAATKLRETELSLYQSYSTGVNYYLGWEESIRGNRRGVDPVREIAALYQSQTAAPTSS